METDRELLEWAAKGAGLRLTWGEKYKLGDDDVDCTDMPYALGGSPDESPAYWNPLEDDGDALRLAVKLNIPVFPYDDETSTGTVGVVAKNWGSKEANTRRAITRAAAFIGKSKEEL